MARNQALVTCPPGVWTQLTNDDVTDITFQVQAGSIKVRGTVGATAPSSLSDPGYVYHAHPTGPQEESGELRVDLTDLFTGAGINRVYATPISGRPAKVIVDHA
jgi:carbon monoxide dehydrogenase subunit G